MFRKFVTAVLAVIGLSLAGAVGAATVFESTDLVGATASADAQLPEVIVFQVSTAGSYSITLQDLSIPAPLETLHAIVTHDLRIVAEAQVSYAGAPAPAIATFTAEPGTYRVHVLAIAPSGSAGGTLGVTVAPAAGGAALVSATRQIGENPGPPAGTSQLLVDFDINDPGTYQLTLTDLLFPAALSSMNVLLTRLTGGPVIVPVVAGEFTVAAPEVGQYQLLVIATAGAAQAGMYSVQVKEKVDVGGNGLDIPYQSVQAVGNVPAPTTIQFPAAGTYTLAVDDLDFPQPLTSLAVVVAQNGGLVHKLAVPGTASISAAQGQAQVFSMATANPLGAFSVRITNSSQLIYAQTHIVDASPAANTPAIYSFEPSQDVTAGSYRLALKDFAFPSAFASFVAAITLNGEEVARTGQASDLSVTLQAGRPKVLIAVTPPAGGDSALFGLRLSAQSAGTTVFESTQGVGGLFRTRTLDIATTGRYDVTLADLEFPAGLRSNTVAITRGTDLTSFIVSSGLVPGIELTAGTYVLNFLGQPATGAQYGTFGLKVEDTPLPTITFTANPTTVTSGQRTTLQWSVTNATSCTAGSGWSGAKSTSGTEESAALSANTTFNLDCTGPGGTRSASVSVTVNAPSANRGGGGGAADLLLLLGVGAALVGRRRMI